jgi:hypothetical protein
MLGNPHLLRYFVTTNKMSLLETVYYIFGIIEAIASVVSAIADLIVAKAAQAPI